MRFPFENWLNCANDTSAASSPITRHPPTFSAVVVDTQSQPISSSYAQRRCDIRTGVTTCKRWRDEGVEFVTDEPRFCAVVFFLKLINPPPFPNTSWRLQRAAVAHRRSRTTPRAARFHREEQTKLMNTRSRSDIILLFEVEEVEEVVEIEEVEEAEEAEEAEEVEEVEEGGEEEELEEGQEEEEEEDVEEGGEVE